VGLVEADKLQDYADAGYAPLEEREARQAQDQVRGGLAPEEQLRQGVTEAREEASFGQAALSAGTFGLTTDSPLEAAQLQKLQRDSPSTAFGAEVAGMLPMALAGGLAGAALRTGVGAAAGAGLANALPATAGAARVAVAGGRVAGFAADFGLNAALGGAQAEAYQAAVEARNFSPTDAAIVGILGEALGRGATWSAAKALGGTRNLVRGATRKVVAEEAEQSLGKGGLLDNYRVASHAKDYQNQVADLSARDMDVVEEAVNAVSSGKKKRTRIAPTIPNNPKLQQEIAGNARKVIETLSDRLEGLDSAPARRLQDDLLQRMEGWGKQPSMGKLWSDLDEIRQGLWGHSRDLHSAWQKNPSHAWLDEDGLRALDQTTRGVRELLLKEDWWGEAAASYQKQYNDLFSQKFFPSEKVVRQRMQFSPEKSLSGRNKWRGDPAKMGRFMKGLDSGPDAMREHEMFSQYLEGVEGILKLTGIENPKVASKGLDSIRRLRKAMDISREINQAAAKHEEFTGGMSALTGGVVGGAFGGGPLGAVFGAHLARKGNWIARWVLGTLDHSGVLKGGPKNVDKILGTGKPEVFEAWASFFDDFVETAGPDVKPKDVVAAARTAGIRLPNGRALADELARKPPRLPAGQGTRGQLPPGEGPAGLLPPGELTGPGGEGQWVRAEGPYQPPEVTPPEGPYRRQAMQVRRAKKKVRQRRGKGPASPLQPAPGAPDFVAQVNQAMAGAKAYHGRKRFIGSVFEQYQAQGGQLDRAGFDEALWQAHKSGELEMTRADLVSTMDPKDVEGSLVEREGGRFHFLMPEEGVPARKAGGAAAVAAGGAMSDEGDGEAPPPWIAAAGLFMGVRARAAKDVARRIFAAGIRPTLTTTSRVAAARQLVEDRRKQFANWEMDPTELLERVEEGFSTMDPHGQSEAMRGTFAAATFLKSKLPRSVMMSSMSVSKLPISSDAMRKYARYEQAALDPRGALKDAAAQKRFSPELIETLETLYPDLLVEVRLHAYEAVQEGGGRGLSIQQQIAYAQLFGGDGTMANWAMSPQVAQAAQQAFAQTEAQLAGGADRASRAGASGAASDRARRPAGEQLASGMALGSR
jgi:hypothetical protein